MKAKSLLFYLLVLALFIVAVHPIYSQRKAQPVQGQAILKYDTVYIVLYNGVKLVLLGAGGQLLLLGIRHNH